MNSNSTSGTSINLEEARGHFKILHDRAATAVVDGVAPEDSLLVLCGFGQDPDTNEKLDERVQHFAIGDVEGMVKASEAWASEPHRNVYLAANLYRAGTKGRGAKADIAAVLALIVDLDNDKGAAPVAIADLPLAPNYSLETSPGNYQSFYIFERALTPAEAGPLAQRLREAVPAADHATKDVAHVWRIGGLPNWPNAAKAKRGRVPSLSRVAQPFTGRFVDPQAIAALEPPSKAAGGDTGGGDGERRRGRPRKDAGAGRAGRGNKSAGDALAALDERQRAAVERFHSFTDEERRGPQGAAWSASEWRFSALATLRHASFGLADAEALQREHPGGCFTRGDGRAADLAAEWESLERKAGPAGGGDGGGGGATRPLQFVPGHEPTRAHRRLILLDGPEDAAAAASIARDENHAWHGAFSAAGIAWVQAEGASLRPHTVEAWDEAMGREVEVVALLAEGPRARPDDILKTDFKGALEGWARRRESEPPRELIFFCRPGASGDRNMSSVSHALADAEVLVRGLKPPGRAQSLAYMPPCFFRPQLFEATRLSDPKGYLRTAIVPWVVQRVVTPREVVYVGLLDLVARTEKSFKSKFSALFEGGGGALAKAIDTYFIGSLDGFTLAPLMSGASRIDGSKLNLWPERLIDPREGNIEPFIKYMERMFPIEEERNIVLGWIYALLAHPEKKLQWCPVLISDQEVGKSTLANLIISCFPTGVASSIGPEAINKQFDGWWDGKIFVVIEEPMGQKRHSSFEMDEALKPFISGTEWRNANIKYGNEEGRQVFVRLMILTNHENAVGADATRYYFPKVTNDKWADADAEGFFSWWRGDGGKPRPAALAALLFEAERWIAEHGFPPMKRAADTPRKDELREGNQWPEEIAARGIAREVVERGQVVALSMVRHVFEGDPSIDRAPVTQQLGRWFRPEGLIASMRKPTGFNPNNASAVEPVWSADPALLKRTWADLKAAGKVWTPGRGEGPPM